MSEIEKITGLPKDVLTNWNVIAFPEKIKIIVIKRRFSKVITIISGFDKGTDLKELCRKMKKKFGVGGTITNGTIELQGKNKDKAHKFLLDLGYNDIEI